MRLSEILRIAAGGSTPLAPPIKLDDQGKALEEILKPLDKVFEDKKEKEEAPHKRMLEQMKREREKDDREQAKKDKPKPKPVVPPPPPPPPAPAKDNDVSSKPGHGINPDAYKKEHGRCPDGFEQDDRGRCKRV